MIKNYFKIVARNLWRYRSYTLINVAGMAIGIAAMVWAYQNYRFSFSFDSFHPEMKTVYRALTAKEAGDGLKGIFPVAAVQAATDDLPGITESVVIDSRQVNIKATGGETFTEQVHFTGAQFFNFFNFPLIAGTKDLSDRSSVLITEKIAEKYFGTENAIGRELIFYAGDSTALPLTVKGVLKNVPLNSTIQFDLLTNFGNQLKPDGSWIKANDWSWFVDAAFFRIPNERDAAALSGRLRKYIPVQNKAREDWKASGFGLITLAENAVQNNMDANGLRERPEDSAAYGPLVFAFLILLSACLNFSNTTIAHANTRLKEIGIRKVMGSTHRQLIVQLLIECSAIVFAAILLSMLLNRWWLPKYNSMFVFVDVKADYLHDAGLLIYLGITLLVVTLMAGAYPAFYISRFNPSDIFRGNIKFGGFYMISRLMLGLQISIAIITVIGGIAFARNAAFQRKYDFGYDLENTISIAIPDKSTYEVLKNEIARVRGITAFAGTRSHIGFNYRNVAVETEGKKNEVQSFSVGMDYPEVMKLKMAAGRSFDPATESDFTTSILVSEKTAALFGWEKQEALGKQLRIDTAAYTIIGVLKDFHSQDFFNPIEPAIMRPVKEERFQYLIVQSDPQRLTQVYNDTQVLWKSLFPLKPFNGAYQNELTVEALNVTESVAKIFKWMALVSILLTATGMFALVSLTALKKMKEIALRKLVGASTMNILVLINKSYLWIFVVAAVLGCLGGFSLTQILIDMIFTINAGVDSSALVIAVMILFMITALVTGIKVWQAVSTTLVKSLSRE